MSQRRVGMKTYLEVQARAEAAEDERDKWKAQCEARDEWGIKLAVAEAFAADHENQIAELRAGMDQAEGRVAELEGVLQEFLDWTVKSRDSDYLNGDDRIEEGDGFNDLEHIYARTRQILSSDGSRIMDVVKAARGLAKGTDWNNGTQAKAHGYRRKLLEALDRLDPEQESDR